MPCLTTEVKTNTNKNRKNYIGAYRYKKVNNKNIYLYTVYILFTFPGVTYQPHSSMTVSVAVVADIGSWLRMVGMV